MKKKPRSLIKKFVLYLFTALFFITTIIFIVFGVKGYFMYREAVKAYPISQMVTHHIEDIRGGLCRIR